LVVKDKGVVGTKDVLLPFAEMLRVRVVSLGFSGISLREVAVSSFGSEIGVAG
jgi:hypothetical protein